MPLRVILRSAVFFAVCEASAHAAPLEFFFPERPAFRADTPKPADILGFEPGEQHILPETLIAYASAVAASSDRVTLRIIALRLPDLAGQTFDISLIV